MILELSKNEVDALVIGELQRRFPRALPISVNYEPRTEGGFCHCHWVPSPHQTEQSDASDQSKEAKPNCFCDMCGSPIFDGFCPKCVLEAKP